SERLGVSPGDVEDRLNQLLDERSQLQSELDSIKRDAAITAYEELEPREVEDISVLTGIVPGSSAETLRELADRFRRSHTNSAVVLGTIAHGKPLLIAALSDSLVARGLHAGKLIQHVAQVVEGGGGGKPGLAQAGGKNPEHLSEALDLVDGWLQKHLNQ
ncbi:MAG: DHHA1 domain-containing protein, partial [Anaerolineales bacterium]